MYLNAISKSNPLCFWTKITPFINRVVLTDVFIIFWINNNIIEQYLFIVFTYKVDEMRDK